MKVLATKVMAKAINDYMNTHATGWNVSYVEMTERNYRMMVDVYAERHEDDWLISKSKMRALVIDYPPEFYANSVYVTTADLLRVFRRCAGTWETFMLHFMEEYEI